MTGLQRWRMLARGLVVVLITWEVIGVIVGLVLLAAFASWSGEVPTSETLVELVGAIGLSGLVLWATRDARKRARRGRGVPPSPEPGRIS